MPWHQHHHCWTFVNHSWLWRRSQFVANAEDIGTASIGYDVHARALLDADSVRRTHPGSSGASTRGRLRDEQLGLHGFPDDLDLHSVASSWHSGWPNGSPGLSPNALRGSRHCKSRSYGSFALYTIVIFKCRGYVLSLLEFNMPSFPLFLGALYKGAAPRCVASGSFKVVHWGRDGR